MAFYKTLMRRTRTPTAEDQVKILTHTDFPSVFFNGYTSLIDNPEFKTGVESIASSVSNMTIMLMANSDIGDERINNQLSRKLDIDPHPYLNRKELIFYIVRNMLVYGNQIVVPVYQRNGDLIKLEPIEPNRVKFKTYENEYRILIDDVEYKPDEILHFRNNQRSNNPYIGEGLTVPLRPILENLGQANKTRKAFMTSKYQPPLVISVDAETKDFKSKDGRKKILDDYLSTTNAGEPFIIPTSMMQVESVKPLTLKDIAINESVELDKKTVAAVLGVPPFLLGVGKYSQTEYNNFINTKVMGIAKLIEQEMTRKLIRSEEMFIKFNSRSLLDYSVTDKINIARTMVSLGLMNGDEARDLMGYSPVGQTDFTMLENYIPKDKLGDQEKLKEVEDEKSSV